MAQIAVHLPGHPEQEDAAGEDQADDLHQLGDHEGKDDPQHQSGDDADQDDALALRRRQARGERADDDRIVAGQHDVDHQHLAERGQSGRIAQIAEIVNDRVPELDHRVAPPASYWFIDAKKSSLDFASFILSSRNCIASTVPICMRMRRSTHIFESVA